jgi:hypothetical protein
MTPQPSDCLHLAEQVSKEENPDKLIALAEELNRILERKEKCKRRTLSGAA